MKIKNIKLKNFKFHNSLEFNINKNSLIYGENGTGKSSIYKALYSNFYYFKDKKIVSNTVNVADKFLHRDFRSEDLKVDIDFDNEASINRSNNTLENSELLHNQTIYLCDEKVLKKIVSMDFYFLVENELIKHFSELDDFLIYQPLEDKLRRLSEERVPREILEMRVELNRKFKETFSDYIPIDEVNKIIKEHLKEDFEIEFIIEDAKILNKKLIPPKISLKIKGVDDKNDFSNHFNEAKLKLISIAIYFALAKKYEIDSDLKLLVLDDFLTSLDMSNRKLIMWYILENFGDYQKIILTHNLQFYNMIVKLLKSKDEERDWDIKNLFLRIENSKEIATIVNRNENYLSKAETELNSYNFEVSGNFLRKEFERIVNEFEQILELGRVEELDNVIKALKNLENLFPEPSKNLKNISNKFNNILANLSTDDSDKYQQLKDEIETIPDKLRFRNNELTFLKETILKTEFYKNILMNSSSHDDRAKELYRKEFSNSIKLLKELNRILNGLK